MFSFQILRAYVLCVYVCVFLFGCFIISKKKTKHCVVKLICIGLSRRVLTDGGFHPGCMIVLCMSVHVYMYMFCIVCMCVVILLCLVQVTFSIRLVLFQYRNASEIVCVFLKRLCYPV